MAFLTDERKDLLAIQGGPKKNINEVNSNMNNNHSNNNNNL